MRTVEYGIGGFDPSKSNDNIIAEYEVPDPPQQALDSAGALATLLAVTGVLTVEDAANSVHLEPAALVAEAEAWAVAQSMSK